MEKKIRQSGYFKFNASFLDKMQSKLKMYLILNEDEIRFLRELVKEKKLYQTSIDRRLRLLMATLDSQNILPLHYKVIEDAYFRVFDEIVTNINGYLNNGYIKIETGVFQIDD